MRSAVIRNESGEILNGVNVQCHDCGLVYVSPAMDREWMDNFYRNEYRKTYGRNEASQMAAEQNHAGNAVMLLKTNLPDIKPKRFLDIGCSNGKLLEKLLEVYGIGIYVGVDPSEREGKFPVYKSLDEVGHKHDLVTMLNTLEHMTNPMEELRKIHNILEDDGYLMISVPDLYNTNIRRPVDAYLSNAHLFNFSRNTLSMMLFLTGFEIMHPIVVTEEIGDKIYVICRKGKGGSVETQRPSPEATRNFLLCVDAIFDLKVRLYGGL
jgi:2-polyprenyl-3-methyl-5-hydroxy-6-metoxy-1,4-benzoquinol methylase